MKFPDVFNKTTSAMDFFVLVKVTKLGYFMAENEENKRQIPDLRDEETARNAFLMSEIFNRKY